MPDVDYDDFAEDDGVLSFADSLESSDVLADLLDVGVDAGEGYRGATRFGTTWAEERSGRTLAQRLAEEEPEPGPDMDWTDEEAPTDDGRVPERRTGRLVFDDRLDRVNDGLVAVEVGIDGGGATAEEAAMHLTDDPPFR